MVTNTRTAAHRRAAWPLSASSREEATAPAIEPAELKTASRARLSSLGRTLKRDTESEKRRFYAIDQWTIEEEMEDFKKLPFETLSELLNEREIHLRQLEAFGPEFKREPKISEAWKLLNGEGHAPPVTNQPRQLTLKFD